MSSATDCGNLPSQDTKITTNSIFRICTTGEGTVFEGWIDVNQRNVSEVPSRISKTNNVYGKQMGFKIRTEKEFIIKLLLL
jgi:hypothetical protein